MRERSGETIDIEAKLKPPLEFSYFAVERSHRWWPAAFRFILVFAYLCQALTTSLATWATKRANSLFSLLPFFLYKMRFFRIPFIGVLHFVRNTKLVPPPHLGRFVLSSLLFLLLPFHFVCRIVTQHRYHRNITKQKTMPTRFIRMNAHLFMVHLMYSNSSERKYFPNPSVAQQAYFVNLFVLFFQKTHTWNRSN